MSFFDNRLMRSAFAAVFAAAMAAAAMSTALADDEDEQYVGIFKSFDSSGKELYSGPAVAVDFGEITEIYTMHGYDDSQESQKFITAFGEYDIEYDEYDDYYYIDSEETDSSDYAFMPDAKYRGRDGEYTIGYFDESYKYHTDYITTDGYEYVPYDEDDEYSDEILNIYLADTPDGIKYPAALVDDDGNCLGIIEEKENAYSYWDAGEFPLIWLCAGGGALIILIIIIVLVLLLNKKKGDVYVPSASSNVNGHFMDRPEKTYQIKNSMQNPMDETSPITPHKDNNENSIKIVCNGGGFYNKIFTFSGNDVTIGRAQNSTIKYPNDTKGVSRSHCKIMMHNGQLMLMDLGSSYGTFVKGKGKLTANVPVTITSGETFYIGGKENELTIK